jgi:hypothetical protein
MAMRLEEESGARAMTPDEELGSMATTLEDSVVSGGGACADANPQLKIKTRVRKKRVIFLCVIFISGSPEFEFKSER